MFRIPDSHTQKTIYEDSSPERGSRQPLPNFLQYRGSVFLSGLHVSLIPVGGGVPQSSFVFQDLQGSVFTGRKRARI